MMEKKFTVGTTLKVDNEFPNGVPCILTGGDSVLCEFRGSSGKMHAAVMCDLLNLNYAEGAMIGMLLF